VDGIVADEQAILASHQRGIKLQLDTLDDLKDLLRSEITSLEQKIRSQERQIDLTKKELEGLGSLADKGLVVNNRILGSERSVADMESKLLDFQTEILRAKQDINKATQEANSITNKAASDLAEERQLVVAAFNQAKLKLETQKNLMAESQSMATNLASTGLPAFAVSYTLVRTVDGKPQEIEADENSTVLPGDIVKVERRMQENTQAAVR
jgi:exopolysaccharide production protein ExoF